MTTCNLDYIVVGCRYGEITGQAVEECGFRVLRDDVVHGWLGASPDGLLQPQGLRLALLCLA